MASSPEQRIVSADDGAFWKVAGHGDSTWPHARKALAELDLARQGEAVLRWATCESCAEPNGIA
jgi:streptomycin 6-kinase